MAKNRKPQDDKQRRIDQEYMANLFKELGIPGNAGSKKKHPKIKMDKKPVLPPVEEVIPPVIEVVPPPAPVVEKPSVVVPPVAEEPPLPEKPTDAPAGRSKKAPFPKETIIVPMTELVQERSSRYSDEYEYQLAREMAFEEAAKWLTDKARNAATEAKQAGYTHYRCDLLMDNDNQRIRLLFQGKEKNLPLREIVYDLRKPEVIGGYDRNPFTNLEVDALTRHATDLRILVNGEVTAAYDDYFQPILNTTKSGTPRFGLNDFIPNRAIFPRERRMEFISKDGMYLLKLTSTVHKNDREAAIIHFPLGVQEERDADKNDTARAIAEERGKMIEKIIDGDNPDPARRRNIPIKKDIQDALKARVDNIRNDDPGSLKGVWISPERIEVLVSGGDSKLNHEYLKRTDPLYRESLKHKKDDPEEKKRRQERRKELSPLVILDDAWKEALTEAKLPQNRSIGIPIPELDHAQSTSLVGIALLKRGTNLTYHLDAALHVNNLAAEKHRKNSAGDYVGSLSLNLGVENPDVAFSRAQEVIFGSKRTMGLDGILETYFRQRPQARWALVEKNGNGGTTKDKLVENLEEQVKTQVSSEQIRKFRHMLQNELKLEHRERCLVATREPAGHGMVEIHASVMEGDKVIDRVVFSSVPEAQADLVEHFARGDIDQQRRNHILRNLVPHFEHDLSVQTTLGEEQMRDGMLKIPVTFSVMRGKRDGIQEQYLDLQKKPVRKQIFIPAEFKEAVLPSVPNREGLAQAVDSQLGMEAAIHYSSIIPTKALTMSEKSQARSEELAIAKGELNEFGYKDYPKFEPDRPKGWLGNAVNSNLQDHVPDIRRVEIETNGHRNGNGSKGFDTPPGVHERFPSALKALQESTAGSFLERLGNTSRKGYERE